jgi:hypothetical protein
MLCLLLGGFVTFALWKEGLPPNAYLAEQGIVLDPAYVLMVSATVTLGGLVGALLYLRLLSFSGKHPHEPWLWDYAWRRELKDEQLTRLLEHLPEQLGIGVLLALVNGVALLGFQVEEHPPTGLYLFAAFVLGLDGVLLWWKVRPFARDVLALLRYGRTCLRLPAIPLALGSRVQVELEVPRGLAGLTEVRAVLRHVRERQEQQRRGTGSKRRTVTVTVRDIDYERVQKVDLGPKERGTVVLELNLPKRPEAGTVLSTFPRRLWELQLTSEVPGLDLDVTFVLPVYAVRGQ